MKGKISVIIPAYNREHLLPATLKSLLNQTVSAMEILVVDDGSADKTAEIAEGIGHPVRVIRQENAGPGAARNRGLSEAVGEYVHFFDSDDIAAPNKHEKQLAVLESTGADIAYCPWIKGVICEDTFSPVTKVFQQRGLPGNLLKALLCDWSIVPNACLFRKSIVEKAGGFPEDMILGEDQLMFLNCLLAGAKVVHSPGTLELYREGNADKITANKGYDDKRPVEWARFLMAAQQATKEADIKPEDWLGFRMRAWAAGRDLRKVENSSALELIEELKAMHGADHDRFYKAACWLSVKRRGLQARILGHRGTRSYKFGSLDNPQKQLILKSGFQITAKHMHEDG